MEPLSLLTPLNRFSRAGLSQAGSRDVGQLTPCCFGTAWLCSPVTQKDEVELSVQKERVAGLPGQGLLRNCAEKLVGMAPRRGGHSWAKSQSLGFPEVSVAKIQM